MAETAALSSNVQLAAALSTLLPSLFGKKEVTSGGGKTEQTILSTEAVQGLLTQLMEGSGLQGSGRQGLAAIARGQKGAGLYNSSTNMQLVNDLMSRISSEVAIAGSPRVTSMQNKTVKTPGIMSNPSSWLLPIALIAGSKKGKAAIKDAYDSIFGTTKIGNESDWFANMRPQDVLTQGGFGADSAALAASSIDPAAFGSWDVLPDAISTAASASAFSDAFGSWDVLPDAVSSVASSAGDVITNFSDFDTGILSMGGEGADAAGLLGDATGGIPYLGTITNALEGDWGGAALTAIGYTIGGPVGGLIGGALDMVFGDDGCFITTAIMRAVGGDDNGPELTTLRKYRDTWLRENHPEDIDEYRRIAPQIVQQINQSPQSNQIWKTLWKSFLIPALREIDNGRNEVAYQIYKDMVMVAKERSAH